MREIFINRHKWSKEVPVNNEDNEPKVITHEDQFETSFSVAGTWERPRVMPKKHPGNHDREPSKRYLPGETVTERFHRTYNYTQEDRINNKK